MINLPIGNPGSWLLTPNVLPNTKQEKGPKRRHHCVRKSKERVAEKPLQRSGQDRPGRLRDWSRGQVLLVVVTQGIVGRQIQGALLSHIFLPTPCMGKGWDLGIQLFFPSLSLKSLVLGYRGETGNKVLLWTTVRILMRQHS